MDSEIIFVSTQCNDTIRSALEDAIREHGYVDSNNRSRLSCLPIHKRSLGLVGALEFLLPDYLCNSDKKFRPITCLPTLYTDH